MRLSRRQRSPATPAPPQQVQNPVQPILFGDFDANGDGVNDFIVSMGPDAQNTLPHVEVRSGVNDGILLDIQAGEPTDFFGLTVARSAGDVNGDGHDDVLVNTARPDAPGSDAVVSFVDVYSGVDGSLLYHFHSSGVGDGFGMEAAPAGDVNNDGFDDILVGAAYSDTNNIKQSGRAVVYSGASGATLYSFSGTQADASMGASVTRLGDVNADGYADIAIAEPGQGVGMSAHVYIYSGLSGNRIYDFTGQSIDGFGRVISSVDDVNADGVAEIAVSAPLGYAGVDPYTGQTRYGRVTLFSPTTGDFISSITGHTGMYYGASLQGTRWDWDGDGVGDLVIGESSVGDPTDLSLAHVYFVSATSLQVISDVALGDLLTGGLPLQADPNNDGVVDITDIRLIVNNLNSDTHDHRADINTDGVVDSRDLMLVLTDFGTSKKDSPLQPQYAFGALPGGACRNGAIAVGAGALVGYLESLSE